ncbi:hypothetical protein VN0139_06180 [Helicobacter pylori]
MLKIIQGALDTDKLLKAYQEEACMKNFGAFCVFVGIVRGEDNIQGLSFDIYEALLKTWFEKWHYKAKDLGVVLKMAHSLGDVLIGQKLIFMRFNGKEQKKCLRTIPRFY